MREETRIPSQKYNTEAFTRPQTVEWIASELFGSVPGLWVRNHFESASVRKAFNRVGEVRPSDDALANYFLAAHSLVSLRVFDNVSVVIYSGRNDMRAESCFYEVGTQVRPSFF